jgi:hypothetical protein
VAGSASVTRSVPDGWPASCARLVGDRRLAFAVLPGQVLGLRRVTDRAVGAQYLTPETARRLLSHFAEQPFFASVTRYVVTAIPS